jgi:hypothetical protein
VDIRFLFDLNLKDKLVFLKQFLVLFDMYKMGVFYHYCITSQGKELPLLLSRQINVVEDGKGQKIRRFHQTAQLNSRKI